LIGGPGNDTLIGGAGSDTAGYSGPRASYTITEFSDRITVSSVAEGTDSLVDIEYASFADQTLSLDAIAFDTLAPSLAITSDVGGLRSGQSASIRFTFSEVPLGFAAGDVLVLNATQN
jgi:Ca2+-binding RTX toxin-like protein